MFCHSVLISDFLAAETKMKVHFQVEKSVIAAVVPVPDTHDRSVGGGDSGMADTARVAEEAVGGIIESNVGDSNNLVLDMLPDSYYYKILTCDIMSETEETLKFNLEVRVNINCETEKRLSFLC